MKEIKELTAKELVLVEMLQKATREHLFQPAGTGSLRQKRSIRTSGRNTFRTQIKFSSRRTEWTRMGR